MSLRQVVGECFALFCAVMLGLAGGAIWLLPSLFLHRPMPYLAVLVGWLLALVIRQWVHMRQWNAALLAAVGTVIAMLYVHVLQTATTLWEMTSGYGLIGIIRIMGVPALWDMARIGIGSRDVFWCFAGVVVAVVVALRSAQRPPNRPTP